MKPLPISPIDSRKQVILKAVVTDYVRTAEPVGSETLAVRYQFGVRSATIRNELAELAEMGYLHQPHTSAGRIPSDLGYRFYVDRLMDAATLSRTEATSARRTLAPRSTEIDTIVEHTCRMLSNLAHYTSLATHPAVGSAVISHITIARVSPRRALAVVVLDSGAVLHELLEFGPGSKRLDPVKATNFLTAKLAGRSLQAAAESLVYERHEEPEMRDLFDQTLGFIRRIGETSAEEQVHLEGASYIVQQPEFRDAERLEAVLRVLDQRSTLYRLFSSVYLGEDVTVIIGAENPVTEMHDCSFVGARYRIGGRVAGTIGLLGPTRMDYRRAVAAVDFMARNLGDLLTQLSIA